MQPSRRLALVFAILLGGIVLGFASVEALGHATAPGVHRWVTHLEAVFNAVNVLLVTVLIVLYARLYGQTRARFTLSLLIFAAVWLLHALTASPILHRAQGYTVGALGPYSFLPGAFSAIAFSLLLYWSLE